jgi:hypothetical protein
MCSWLRSSLFWQDRYYREQRRSEYEELKAYRSEMGERKRARKSESVLKTLERQQELATITNKLAAEKQRTRQLTAQVEAIKTGTYSLNVCG